ncbi:efflux RND transporter permease subunit [Endozoicomonas sp. SCSIO W0465]|uniref:efflux RND transporter permease subunit n=1 Tax=Endozoicomonas sp. SCSIO W0465 TaxID=2918516 RepID=UPI0020755754|nr:efflux RND transporter permease subunit [Endozoicomonas sp. SCSIO W0465]USE35374.1 efflux RND transporter permease subunit [Endozoicomonas sp. SCSIO W0465]
MNIAEYSISHRVISWMFVVILLVGGALSFLGLGQLEFPEFTIKQTMVITHYPGASPEQVEEEVTLPLEEAIQQMEYVKHIDSISSNGRSQIMVEMKDRYDKNQLPQIWDELRRKINDSQSGLPPGVYPSVVVDDYSDVYGMLFNITGEGYTSRDLENYADYLKRELVLVEGVKKVTIAGARQEQVVVEMSQAKLANLGIDPAWIFSLIQHQNVVSNAGNMLVEGRSIRIHPTGEFNNVQELEQLIISPPGSTQLVRLGDIATVRRDFDETPDTLYYSNGRQALSLGISFASGVNVVDAGDAVRHRIDELKSEQPVGIELTKVYDQPATVSESVNGFLINLLESIAIVIVVLLLAMGVRSGLLMGAVLLLTILGTFIVMKAIGIELQLVSLGALIIALGMLVDNAIVVTEGIQVGIQRGLTRLQAAKQVVSQNQWPLLGATVIAIMAFAPIGLSDDATGEFCLSLFQVLLISLFLSWITAITLTPFFCNMLFKKDELARQTAGEAIDPYKGALFTLYKQLLGFSLVHRPMTIGLTVLALVLAILGFGSVKNVFFPPSNTPMFFVDFWMPEGSDIRATEARVEEFEQLVMTLPGVKNVTTVIGQGAQRFILPYMPEKQYSSFGQLIIETDNLDAITPLIPTLETRLTEDFGDVEYRVKYLQNGPSAAAEIEARFYGEDPEVLRSLAVQAINVLREEPMATHIRHGWRNQVSLVRPHLDEASARRSGISKQALDDALLVNFTGRQVGVYREGSQLMPLIVRSPESERLNADSITDLQVWSADHNSYVPITQAISSFDTEWENPLIIRRDRKRMLSVMDDPELLSDETADSVFRKVRTRIEAIPLPDGYQLEWGGAYELSSDAESAVFASIPLGYLGMFLITVLLFNTIRQPIAIWCTVPLALIGVVAGLLALNAPFSFMALLGLLSLSGMIIKNGIVLVEQIKLELEEGREEHEAIFHASVSRLRPVCMAALTTMLGMIPLLFDAFFKSMAVTIIFGLGFATVLTLIVLPVIYSLLYKISFKGFDYRTIAS